LILRPAIFNNRPVVAAQSTRLGGVSQQPYESLNLGSMTNDHTDTIEKNKKIFATALGFNVDQIVKSKQVHGIEILIANTAGNYDGYDAIITNKQELLLAVSTADCTPIIIYDCSNKVIAAIHAGWKGTSSKLVDKTLKCMEVNCNTKPENCIAYIGPCIDECSFEVDGDVADNFADEYKRYDEIKNKYFVNLKEANKVQLINLGVKEEYIEVSPYDTYTRTDLFFSHRKENGVTGRMWTAIGLKN
jgi:polyphenol oxidase